MRGPNNTRSGRDVVGFAIRNDNVTGRGAQPWPRLGRRVRTVFQKEQEDSESPVASRFPIRVYGRNMQAQPIKAAIEESCNRKLLMDVW